MNAPSRLNALRLVVTAAYACGVLLSPKLWFGLGRTFPRAPLISGIPAFLSSTDYLLSILLLMALAFAAISKQPRRYLIAAAMLTGLLVLFDQLRLQPWVYQYLIMLLILACRPPNTKAVESTFAANQLVIACLYFWSGTQKLNWSFGHEVLPALLESIGIHSLDTNSAWLWVVGIGLAVCEALIAVALVVRKSSRAAVLVAISLHALVLVTLVITWRNSVVWPWNITMMMMVALLFPQVDQPVIRQALWRTSRSDLASYLTKAVFVICGLAPALSFVGWWDLYLSAALYSGNTPVAVMHINEPVRSRLPATARGHVFTTKRGEVMLPFYEWSLADLNVPPYPEVRVYRKLARQVCEYATDQNEIELIVRERPALLDGSSAVTKTRCSDLFVR